MTEVPRLAEIEFPADSRYVATARNFAADAARDAGWLAPDQFDDLRLIVSETVTNALRAHLAQQIEAAIRVESRVYDDRVEITVIDSAQGFRPPEPVPGLPEPDMAREGGFGLPLMDALSDEVYFTTTRTGTAVRLVVRRND